LSKRMRMGEKKLRRAGQKRGNKTKF